MSHLWIAAHPTKYPLIRRTRTFCCCMQRVFSSSSYIYMLQSSPSLQCCPVPYNTVSCISIILSHLSCHACSPSPSPSPSLSASLHYIRSIAGVSAGAAKDAVEADVLESTFKGKSQPLLPPSHSRPVSLAPSISLFLCREHAAGD